MSDRTTAGPVGDFTTQATTTTLSWTNYVYDEADRVVQTNRWVHVPNGVNLTRSTAAPTGDTGPLDGNGTNYKPFARSLPGCSFPSTQATDWIADRQIYDRVGRVVQRQGNPSPTVAPVAGLASGSPVPLSKTTYDGLGRAIKTVDALGNANESWFDANGNVWLPKSLSSRESKGPGASLAMRQGLLFAWLEPQTVS